jgi:hypothetical protein
MIDDDDDDDMAWEYIRENMKASATDSLGYYELKQHRAEFDEECSKLLDHKGSRLNCNSCRIQVKQMEVCKT